MEAKMPGYTGYKPQFQDETPTYQGESVARDNRFYIPGRYITKKLSKNTERKSKEFRALLLSQKKSIIQYLLIKKIFVSC